MDIASPPKHQMFIFFFSPFPFLSGTASFGASFGESWQVVGESQCFAGLSCEACLVSSHHLFLCLVLLLMNTPKHSSLPPLFISVSGVRVRCSVRGGAELAEAVDQIRHMAASSLWWEEGERSDIIGPPFRQATRKIIGASEHSPHRHFLKCTDTC